MYDPNYFETFDEKNAQIFVPPSQFIELTPRHVFQSRSVRKKLDSSFYSYCLLDTTELIFFPFFSAG